MKSLTTTPGISEDDVKGTSSSIRDVQETLLSFVSAETILIGHGLETAITAIKATAPRHRGGHRLGLPHKITLHNLTPDYLRRIIQESVGGHDSAEDAAGCIELMLWKVKEDGKTKQ
ncbi:unnamed protein product, partial [Coregonus sp. 'balchen']